LDGRQKNGAKKEDRQPFSRRADGAGQQIIHHEKGVCPYFSPMEYYDALGLNPKLSLDADDLKKRFYERSREWHPDRFSRRSPDEQKQALDMTAMLNDAFRTLREPVKRAEYFLEKRGLGPSKTPPAELLEEVFELNMALEELRGGDASVRSQLADAEKRFADMRLEIDTGLAGLYSRYDAGEDSAVLAEIRAALDRRRYVSNLMRDVEKELHGAENNARGAENQVNV
jgi:molecular chaperone HscB